MQHGLPNAPLFFFFYTEKPGRRFSFTLGSHSWANARPCVAYRVLRESFSFPAKRTVPLLQVSIVECYSLQCWSFERFLELFVGCDKSLVGGIYLAARIKCVLDFYFINGGELRPRCNNTNLCCFMSTSSENRQGYLIWRKWMKDKHALLLIIIRTTSLCGII